LNRPAEAPAPGVTPNLPVSDRGSFEIVFRVGGNGADHQRGGWSGAEPRHTWTIGTDSAVELPRPTTPGAYVLELKVAPFVWGDKLPVQRLVVRVGDTEIGRFAINQPARLRCPLPWDLIAHNDRIAVAFHHPDAARPVEISGAADDRVIALAFETVSLAAAREPVGEPASSLRNAAAVAALEAQAASGDYRDLMVGFESLGQNCEFGLVQRRCGAEPLGLLRFSSTPLPSLMAALEGNFDGLGRPENLDVQVAPNGREYMVLDRCYGLLYHPWVLVGEATAEEVHRREVMRLPYLTRKLVEDLTEAQKIFVYHGFSALSADEAAGLAAALRRYGPNTLLWVGLEEPGHPAGTVATVAEGLLKGFIDRFAPGENAHYLSLWAWIETCRNAQEMRRPVSGA
jgi:hypothetical protein